MFLTQEKARRKIQQERGRGDLRRAQQRAIEALEKWPQDLDLAQEAIQISLEISDFKTAVTLMKSSLRSHPRGREHILAAARETLHHTFNPFLASFAVEVYLHGRDIEAAREIIRIGPPNYLSDMINRSRTRSSAFERQHRSEGFVESELLLGLLLIEAERFDEAVTPLGAVLSGAPDPENARLFGTLLIEIERRRPQNAEIQFFLGLASTILDHPDKAETRLFRALELEHAPADRIADLLASNAAPSPNHLLLRGEALIETGRVGEGIELIRRYLGAGAVSENDAGRDAYSGGTDRDADSAGTGRDAYSGGDAGCGRDTGGNAGAAFERLEKMITRHPDDIELTLLYAEIAAGLDRQRQAVEALERCHERNPDVSPRVAAWIADSEALANSAPAWIFLVRLLIEAGEYERAADAALRASGIDSGAVHTLLKTIDAAQTACDDHPSLLAAQAELLARAGDGQRACEIVRRLDKNGSLGDGELMRLSSAVLRDGGLNLDGIAAAIDLGIRGGTIDEALEFTLEFYRRSPEEHGELAARIEECAAGPPEGWKHAARLCDLMAEHEQLDRPLLILRAKAHLHAGEIERAVFEFDQLIMFDEALRCDLVGIYEKAAAAHPRNTTLHLALYQLHLEEERFASASHHLGRALESDPAQIRDVIQRFDRLVERDPGNKSVWDEMLGAAQRMNHIEFARELFKRALRALSEADAAALHIHGAKIARAENRFEDALVCLSQTLRSPQANLAEIEGELAHIIERDPERAEARLLLGETLLRLGAEERAATEFESCLGRDAAYRDRMRETLERHLPLCVMPWRISRLLGEIAWDAERFDDARRLFESAQKGPSESLAGLISTLEKLRRVHPADPDLALILARSLVLYGRGDEAVALVEPLVGADNERAGTCAEIVSELCRRDPSHPGANRILARLLTRSGDAEGALRALLRLAEAPEAPARGLVGMIEEFLPAHGNDPRLLVPLAGLRGRADDFPGALADLRAALELDPQSRDAVLAASERIDWPDLHRREALLLEADALIAGGFMRDAFAKLERIETRARPEIDELLERLRPILDTEPARDHYLFAGQLLARGGDVDAAEDCLRGGAVRLGGDDSCALLIALGEILSGAELAERAAACFREVLARGGDRGPILKRIETAWRESTRAEIERGLQRIAAGDAKGDEALRIARIAVEAGEFAAAGQALSACGRGDAARILRTRMHLDAGRPLLALLAARGGAADATDSDHSLELLYIEGIAHERLGDFGRAAAAYSRIAAIADGYRDCGRRALQAYTNHLEAPDGEPTGVLVALGDLGRGTGKEQP